VSLLAATAIVTALVGLPAGATAPPPGSIPHGAQVQVLDRQLGIVSVELPRAGSAAALARLRAGPGVRYVTIPAAASGGLASGCTFQTPAAGGLHPGAWRKTIALTTHSAAGFTVGIPDTGADLGRLGGSRARTIFKNFTQNHGVGDTIDHGTEIASLIGGDRPDLKIKGVALKGVAPDVGLAIARIATTDNCEPALLAQHLIDAFHWFRQIGDVEVVNVSLTLAGNPALVESLHALQQSGTLVVAATGNDPTPGKTTFPASEPHVIGVGALGSSTSKVWPDSGRGPFVDLVAPGAGSGVIISSDIPSDQQWSVTPEGTSFATPLVTGAAVLVWARHPSWDASRVAAALMLSAKHLSGARPNTNSGYGRLNVKAALKITPPADLDEPNDWSSAARGVPVLAHGPLLHATVGGPNDPLDAYPLTTTARSTVRITGKGVLQAYLLRSGAIDAIDAIDPSAAVRSASSASGTGRSIVLKVPRAGNWFVVVTAKGATASGGYTLRVG
jgi:subtilisin family serine protease